MFELKEEAKWISQPQLVVRSGGRVNPQWPTLNNSIWTSHPTTDQLINDFKTFSSGAFKEIDKDCPIIDRLTVSREVWIVIQISISFKAASL